MVGLFACLLAAYRIGLVGVIAVEVVGEIRMQFG